MTRKAIVVNLKSAYLQIHLSKKLWQYHLVQYKCQTYCLTTQGLGLNSTPKIMATVLESILEKVDKIKKTTNSNTDDILVERPWCLLQRLWVIQRSLGWMQSQWLEGLQLGWGGDKLQRDKTDALMFWRGTRSCNWETRAATSRDEQVGQTGETKLERRWWQWCRRTGIGSCSYYR